MKKNKFKLFRGFFKKNNGKRKKCQSLKTDTHYSTKGNKNMSYNVLDVCRYIINYSNEHDYGISNLKLQKILYFVQAYFLINTKDHMPCFAEKIEAWDFGPVVPAAYHEYKQYGSGDIPDASYFLFDFNNIWDSGRVDYNNDAIAPNDKILINQVIDKFANYTATDLVTLTHKQSPWIDAYVPNQNNEISLGSIMEYFNG